MTAARVGLVTLGCGRNEVDSSQVAGSLAAAGYDVCDDVEDADCILVNTCTFIEPARRESIDQILAAADVVGAKVLVIGCMAQRYGEELDQALPEVAGVIGFADYPRLPDIVADVLAGRPVVVSATPDAPTPSAPSAPAAPRGLPVLSVTGDAAPAPTRQRPPTAQFPVRTAPRGVWAYLKLAGGCDRVCTFCTIPSYRGRFRSRSPEELEAEARWLVDAGARELVGVSENTTSYGKDTSAGRDAQVELIRRFDSIEGLARVRLLYLQPAELSEALIDAMAASRVVAGYYDLSLQHASGPVLARMARSGDAQRFLALIARIRSVDPEAVFRSSFILGFPGETDADVDLLGDFLSEARLDWTGMFTFSPEDGTPAALMADQIPADEAQARRNHLLDIAESVADDNAAAWIGRRVEVLVETVHDDGTATGRSHREGPETDGEVTLYGAVGNGRSGDGRSGDGRSGDGAPGAAPDFVPGQVVAAKVTASDGVDLFAQALAGVGVR